jgi:hypothetical protein
MNGANMKTNLYVKLERSKNNLTLFSQKLFKLYALIEEEIKKEVKIFRGNFRSLRGKKGRRKRCLNYWSCLTAMDRRNILRV